MERFAKYIAISLAIAATLWVLFIREQVFPAATDYQETSMAPEDPSIGRLDLTDAEWKKRLTPEQYHILREAGTEPAFHNKYFDAKGKGVYQCAGCSLPLFSSEAKYDSGTGWPSFREPIKANHVYYREDRGLLSARIEVLCSRCDGHLGHVFDDGPPPSGKRYCMNSAALTFVADTVR